MDDDVCNSRAKNQVDSVILYPSGKYGQLVPELSRTSHEEKHAYSYILFKGVCQISHLPRLEQRLAKVCSTECYT